MSILQELQKRIPSVELPIRLGEIPDYLQLARDLPKLAPWAKISPAQLLADRVANQPNALALAYLDERYSWSELDQRASQYAACFAREGVARGDVVALVMDNRPDYLFSVMGLGKLGAVAALINTNLSGKPLVHSLNVGKAKKILAGAEHATKIEEIIDQVDGVKPDRDFFVQTEEGSGLDRPTRARLINEELDGVDSADDPKLDLRAEDIFCYIYTSGTTGLPKAAIIRNKRFMAASVGFGRLMHRSSVGDVIYTPLPLYHSNAMMLGWGSALVTGAGLALRRKFSASGFWDDVRQFNATSFVYIGELCRYLLNSPKRDHENQHRLKVAVGNGLRPDVWEPFQQRFALPLVREFYASTEGNAPVLNLSGRPGMIGRMPLGQSVVRCDQTTGELLRNADGFCEQVAAGETGLLVGRISKLLSFDGYVDKRQPTARYCRMFSKRVIVISTPAIWCSFTRGVGFPLPTELAIPFVGKARTFRPTKWPKSYVLTTA